MLTGKVFAVLANYENLREKTNAFISVKGYVMSNIKEQNYFFS